MKNFLLWVAVVLVALVILVMAGGWFLPDSYPAHVVMKINQSPAVVWAAVADYEKHPISGAMRKSTQKLPDENGLPVWIEDIGETRLRVQVVSAQPPNHIKWQFTDEVVKSLSAWSETHIAAEGSGSLITTHSETRIVRGSWHVPIFKVILWMTRAHEKGVRDYWTSVGQSLGETPQFTQ
jgi:hypothetical protein